MELIPRFNIAPTQMAPVIVVENGEIVLKPMRWGLVPFWATDLSIGNRLINARAESVRDKPAFRNSFKRRRCLVVADSLYEWKKVPGSTRKQPMRILLKDEQPFAFAGLWSNWTSPEGSELESFTIITGAANELVSPIHDRMAVILRPEDHPEWLDPKLQDTDRLSRLLAPYNAAEMQAYAVNPAVNNSKFEDPLCVEPLGKESGPASELPFDSPLTGL